MGFLPGRSLKNVIEIDHSMAEFARTGNDSCVVFFDFKAAFPSLAHTFMHRALEEIGVPKRTRNYIEALYDNNFGYVTIGGSRYDFIDMKAGIRQGCPLSPSHLCSNK